MSGFGPLFFLWLLSQGKTDQGGGQTRGGGGGGRGGGGGGGGRGGGGDPFHMAPGAPAQPVSYGGGGALHPWVPYAPLHPEVIARAEALLHDVGAPPETIEPDPYPITPGGVVRYLKTHNNPPGHTSVTAWRHRTEVTPMAPHHPGPPLPGEVPPGAPRTT